MFKKIGFIALLSCFSLLAKTYGQTNLPPIKVSANHRYFEAGGKPFFWLGDTGWLLFSKMNRQETLQYLDIRSKQGFNVVQVMVVHSIKEVNTYGDSALANKKIIHPKVTPGDTFGKDKQYDYWDHIDWIISRAAERGIYVALVPVWGSVVKESHISPQQGRAYAEFLAKRYRDHSNIVWMNGGDVPGTDSLNTWKTIGNTLRKLDPDHLITYHPRGRTQSSTWFHHEDWLDFNSIQSGHRNYAQDTSKNDLNYGEDNWRYIDVDYAKTPAKPTLDAEPSYEDIPYGLHNIKLPRWNAADVRRYGYWSVFAGACGYTYGNNDVMQMHKAGEKMGAYGSTLPWTTAINMPGAKQMVYLKKLMLSRPYLERVPDQSLIAAGQGKKYDRLLATRGKKYAFIYTYNGRNMQINAEKLEGSKVKASWYNPRNGQITVIGTFNKSKLLNFNPPGIKKTGNDWVLILDAV